MTRMTRTEATAACVQYSVQFRMCTTLIIILDVIFLIFDILTFETFTFGKKQSSFQYSSVLFNYLWEAYIINDKLSAWFSSNGTPIT